MGSEHVISEGFIIKSFDKNEKVSIKFILLYFIFFTLLTVGIIVFIFGSGIFDGLVESTNGVVQRSLLPNIFIVLVCVYGLLIVYGKVKPRDLGLEREKIPQAVSVIALVIILLQIISTIIGAVTDMKLTLGNLWSNVSISTAVGILLCQIFAVAVQEEIIFRGFLIPQVYLRIKKNKSIVRMGAALAISQGLFAVWHIPIRIFSGMTPVEIITSIFTVFMLGIMFALIYIRTDNIFIAMGLHGLWNAVQATAASNIYIFILLFIMAAVVFQGPRLQKSNSKSESLSNIRGSL